MLPHLVPHRGCATRGTDSEQAPSMQALTMSANSAACGSNTCSTETGRAVSGRYDFVSSVVGGAAFLGGSRGSHFLKKRLDDR